MYIGNIVTEENIKIDPIFNVVNTKNKCIDGIPTIIVGLEKVKDYELDFTNRVLSDNNYWTFTKKESRKHNIIDISNFETHCFNTLKDSINYIFIDPIQNKMVRVKKILNKINQLKNIITYNYENKMLYLYSDNLIFGVDLNLCKYLNINTDKVISKIKQKSTTFLSGSEILIKYKDYMVNLNNEVKYIPLLYSIRHDR